MNFLIEHSHFTDFINMDTFTRIGRCAIENGLGAELLRCALADTNSRPALAENFIRKNLSGMQAAFRSSDRVVIEDMDGSPRKPIIKDQSRWSDEGIKDAIKQYLDSNTVRNDRMLEWYQHLTTSCAMWEFPRKEYKTKLPPVWDAATCTPDIPYKATVHATFKGNTCWQSWLDGKYFVLSLRGSSPRNRDTEPHGALKVSNHLLASFALGSKTAIIPTGGYALHCFGKLATGPITVPGQPRILHYERESRIPDIEWEPLSQQPTFEIFIGAINF
jgi:hypothetical protein